MTTLTAKDIYNAIGFDHVSESNGVFKVFRKYVSTIGSSPATFYDLVSARLALTGINHTMLECGDHYVNPYENKSGTSMEDFSYFWATFTIDEKSLGKQVFL